MRKALLVPLIALMPIACGGGIYTPKPGTWQFLEGAVQSDTCKLSPTPSEGNGSFTLALKTGGFTIDPGDAYDGFDCAQTGNDYTCPSRLRGEVDLASATGGVLQGTLKLNVAISGSFSSEVATAGTETGSIDCTGTGCATAASTAKTTFPCSTTRAFTATGP